MKTNKLLFILITIAVIFSPFDFSIFVNRTLGWDTHIILWLGLIAVIIYMMPGKGLKKKIRNLIKSIKGMVNF